MDNRTYKERKEYYAAWNEKDKELYRSGQIIRTCKECQEEFAPTSRRRYWCKPCENARNKKAKVPKRQLVYNHYKNNPCEMCGESRIPCLQLDHIDPSTKSFNLGKAESKSEEAILNEIAKCRVMCANCHAMATAEQQGWYKDLE